MVAFHIGKYHADKRNLLGCIVSCVTECIAKYYASQEGHPTCTLPWQWKLNLSMELKDYKPCQSQKDFMESSQMFGQFGMDLILGNLLPSCPGNQSAYKNIDTSNFCER